MTPPRRFAASSESVGAARRFVAEIIADAPLDVRESVSVMVSELATNALLHAGGGFDVFVDRADPSLLVSVSDRGDAVMPRMRAPATSDPHGRGLRVVDALSEEWGVSQTDDGGKSVWFRVLLPPTSASSTSGDPDAAAVDLRGVGASSPDGSVDAFTDSAPEAPDSSRPGTELRLRAGIRRSSTRRHRVRSTQ